MNFDGSAKKIILENLYMTIATSDNNIPWVTPVVFAVDKKYTFYWTSSKNTKHSQIINRNNNITCVIFNSHSPWGTGEAVYFEGIAQEVNKDEIQYAIEKLFVNRWEQFNTKEKPQFTNSDFLDNSDWRMYKVAPARMWLLSDKTKVEENGHLIDKRIEIKLS